MSTKIHGKVVFHESWLGDERFKTWLKRGNDRHRAVCILCSNSVIDTITVGVSALVSHAARAKHKERLRTYNPISSLCSMNKNVNKDTPKATSTPRLDSLMSSVAVSQAEIYWAMKVHWSHLSFRSCLNLNELFWKMFPDSQVAKSFQLSKTNCAYYVVFGLVRYFKEILVKDIKFSPFYSLSFDESLNNKLQEEQMDISIRFWNGIAGEPVTRYFDSRFF